MARSIPYPVALILGALAIMLQVALGAHSADAADYDLLIAQRNSSFSNILLYDYETGDHIKTVASGIRVGCNMAYGPDGDIYVADAYQPIYRIDGQTLELEGQIATASRNHNNGITFGPDGLLYVSGPSGSRIERIDVTTGNIVDNFATDVDSPQGLVFGPDGNVYVASYRGDTVFRYNGQTGELIDEFVSGAVMDKPRGLTFGPDGNLYVSSWATGDIFRFDGTTGNLIDTFATAPSVPNIYGPSVIQFGPDGHFYVCTIDVRRYDGNTGEFMDIVVDNVHYVEALLFVPEPTTLGLLAIGAVTMLVRHK